MQVEIREVCGGCMKGSMHGFPPAAQLAELQQKTVLTPSMPIVVLQLLGTPLQLLHQPCPVDAANPLGSPQAQLKPEQMAGRAGMSASMRSVSLGSFELLQANNDRAMAGRGSVNPRMPSTHSRGRPRLAAQLQGGQ